MTSALREREAAARVSDEARRRIEEARIRDVGFRLRHQIGPDVIDADDAKAIARALIEILDAHEDVNLQDLISKLVAHGRSRHKAEILAGLLFSNQG